jgi:hypothetical protein
MPTDSSAIERHFGCGAPLRDRSSVQQSPLRTRPQAGRRPGWLQGLRPAAQQGGQARCQAGRRVPLRLRQVLRRLLPALPQGRAPADVRGAHALALRGLCQLGRRLRRGDNAPRQPTIWGDVQAGRHAVFHAQAGRPGACAASVTSPARADASGSRGWQQQQPASRWVW